MKKVKEINGVNKDDKGNLNGRKIQFYISLMEKTHEKVCGKNCIHLHRFNDFLRKNQIKVQRKMFPISKHVVGDHLNDEELGGKSF